MNDLLKAMTGAKSTASFRLVVTTALVYVIQTLTGLRSDTTTIQKELAILRWQFDHPGASVPSVHHTNVVVLSP